MRTYELYVYDRQTDMFCHQQYYELLSLAKNKSNELSANGYTGYIKNYKGKIIKRF